LLHTLLHESHLVLSFPLLPLLLVHFLVAVDAHTVGIVHAFGVAAISRQRGSAESMIAVVTHPSGVVLPISVLTSSDFIFLSIFLPFGLCLSYFLSFITLRLFAVFSLS
jgi:hypothetical protein